ncbi:hypothetical protein CpipJ_CPIJ019357 [Culex quinquefasciatus]|uniref:Uncharacterized protein n=1 Tax=Culex quinquefasciatus TaxID=7176 RepID=B0XKI1_CULQU|nr:hypothetical protein CpipJ_CPIJ019357 [Culex quinquefasciatus]|eukprot:XP_001870153.1 hypothetical protein CpipJ_CPIJ019357 [Culex quinquefasciatus]
MIVSQNTKHPANAWTRLNTWSASYHQGTKSTPDASTAGRDEHPPRQQHPQNQPANSTNKNKIVIRVAKKIVRGSEPRVLRSERRCLGPVPASIEVRNPPCAGLETQVDLVGPTYVNADGCPRQTLSAIPETLVDLVGPTRELRRVERSTLPVPLRCCAPRMFVLEAAQTVGERSRVRS